MSIEFKVVLAILATYRFTVLLVTDEGPYDIIRIFREWSFKYTRILLCPHCVGIWMAIFCVLMMDTFMFPAIVVLAVAGGQSFMESCLEKKWKIDV